LDFKKALILSFFSSSSNGNYFYGLWTLESRAISCNFSSKLAILELREADGSFRVNLDIELFVTEGLIYVRVTEVYTVVACSYFLSFAKEEVSGDPA
jgi:hypothetical protein